MCYSFNQNQNSAPQNEPQPQPKETHGTPPLAKLTMNSKRIHPPAHSGSSEQPCKRRYDEEKKKTVSFSSAATLRRVSDDRPQTDSSWLTGDEVSSMKKRAKNLSKFHYFKTRPGRAKAPTADRSGIVYNCHPAHYEIIGESLRGMEHVTDVSHARRRERVRSDAISIVKEHQNQDRQGASKESSEATSSKLAFKYRESTKEAMAYSRKIAEEDAKAAANILAEDLKEDSFRPQHHRTVSEESASSVSSSMPSVSNIDTVFPLPTSGSPSIPMGYYQWLLFTQYSQK